MVQDTQDILRQLWAMLNSEILPILNEDGENMSNAQIRELPGGCWLCVDDVDGFCIVGPDDGLTLAGKQF